MSNTPGVLMNFVSDHVLLIGFVSLQQAPDNVQYGPQDVTYVHRPHCCRCFIMPFLTVSNSIVTNQANSGTAGSGGTPDAAPAPWCHFWCRAIAPDPEGWGQEVDARILGWRGPRFIKKKGRKHAFFKKRLIAISRAQCCLATTLYRKNRSLILIF